MKKLHKAVGGLPFASIAEDEIVNSFITTAKTYPWQSLAYFSSVPTCDICHTAFRSWGASALYKKAEMTLLVS